MLHLICNINLPPRCLRRLDSRAFSMPGSEFVGPGSIPDGCISNFFPFFLLENFFSFFFSSFQSRMTYQNKSEKL